MKRILAIAAITALSGCTSGPSPNSPAAIAQYRHQCAQYGFKNGTDKMAVCIENKANLAANARAQHNAKVSAGLAHASAIMLSQPPAPAPVIMNTQRRCTSRPDAFGNIHTSCW